MFFHPTLFLGDKMETENAWFRFMKSGKVDDYLNFVETHKENKISERNGDSFYNRGACNKGNECGGE